MESENSSIMKQRKFYRLRCSVQNYDWGRKGHGSQVARFFALNSGAVIEPDKPYAELWMGTHGSGPSFLVQTGENGVSVDCEESTLKSWILKNPNVLGDNVVQKWGCDLPFLFKVLSVAKALSIQAHPDKESAKLLHKLQPNVYKDANHKPEMALAITEFEALCGFVSVEELKSVIQTVPELVELVGPAILGQVLSVDYQDGEERVRTVLRLVFTQIMSAGKEIVTTVVFQITARLLKESQERQLTNKEQLVLLLEKQYPSDVGVISAFFLNYVKLNSGEALYLGANEPHAYINGECIEVMATSDNVVRAGLTPKHRDVHTLCAMLTYKQGFPEILRGVPLNPYTWRYRPPFDEFEVDRCVLPRGESVKFPAIPGPSIFLIMFGEGIIYTDSSTGDLVTEGDVLFAPANTKMTITGKNELQLYRAGVNSRFFEAT